MHPDARMLGSRSAAAVVVRRSIDLAGRTVSYLTVDAHPTGEGPLIGTLLLIHGSGVSARTWVAQLRGLADTVRPIALDLPGHGGSDPIPEPALEAYAETALDLVERVATGPTFVAGHSLGGAVAQLVALRDPERVKGLVLVSTCAKLPHGDGGQRLLGFVPVPFRGAVFLWAVRRALLAPTASSAAVELTLDEIRRCHGVTIQCDTALGRSMDMTAIAQGLRVPTLVLCGARDRLTPPELSRALAGLIAGSHLLIVPDAGHMLPLEAPDTVNDAIRAFVAAVSDGARPAAPPPSRGWRRFLTGLAAMLSRRRRGTSDPARAPLSPPPAS